MWRGQVPKNFGLGVAKPAFSVFRKDLRNRETGLRGNDLIGIDASEARESLEPPAHGRFTGAHKSDKDDRPNAIHRHNMRGYGLRFQCRVRYGAASARETAGSRCDTPYNPVMSDVKALVAVIMGSKSDWETMSVCVKTLEELGIPNEAKVLSAHRTPDATVEFARGASKRGIRVIIAAAGGAAHLAGVLAAYTWLPVLGVPMQSQALQGLDSLLSISQMPGGIPVGTLAIGSAGAKNAALLAAAILATSDDKIRSKLEDFRKKQTESVLAQQLPK